MSDFHSGNNVCTCSSRTVTSHVALRMRQVILEPNRLEIKKQKIRAIIFSNSSEFERTCKLARE